MDAMCPTCIPTPSFTDPRRWTRTFKIARRNKSSCGWNGVVSSLDEIKNWNLPSWRCITKQYNLMLP